MSVTRDRVAAREQRQADARERDAQREQRESDRINLEADAACHGLDTSDLEARHDAERAAERTAETEAQAAEAATRDRDVREAWTATREIADDNAKGSAMEARVYAFFDELERRDLARQSQHDEPPPPELDDDEAEL